MHEDMSTKKDSAEVPVLLDMHDVASTISALVAFLHGRVQWAFEPGHWARHIDYDMYQAEVDDAAQAYSKLMMTAQDQAHEFSEGFIGAFSISSGLWDVITGLSLASSWNEVEFHPDDECEICEELR